MGNAGERWSLAQGCFHARWGHGRCVSSALWGEYSGLDLASSGDVEALQGGQERGLERGLIKGESHKLVLMKLKDIDRVQVQQGERRRIFLTANGTRRLEILLRSSDDSEPHLLQRRPAYQVFMCTIQAQRRRQGLPPIECSVVPPLRQAELTLALTHFAGGPLGIDAALGHDGIPLVVMPEEARSGRGLVGLVGLGIRGGERITSIAGEATLGRGLADVRTMLKSPRRPLRITLERHERGSMLEAFKDKSPGASSDSSHATDHPGNSRDTRTQLVIIALYGHITLDSPPY